MRHQTVHRAGLVVNGKLIHDGLRGLVHADNLDLCRVTAELQDRRVQRLHRGSVPDMGAADVDDHLFCRWTKGKAFMNASTER